MLYIYIMYREDKLGSIPRRTEILLLYRLEIDVLILLSAKLMFKYTTEFDYIRKKVLRKVARSRNLY